MSVRLDMKLNEYSRRKENKKSPLEKGDKKNNNI